MYACMHIYCYVQINYFVTVSVYFVTVSVHVYIYKCGTLQRAIYMMLIYYVIDTRVGILVDALW